MRISDWSSDVCSSDLQHLRLDQWGVRADHHRRVRAGVRPVQRAGLWPAAGAGDPVPAQGTGGPAQQAQVTAREVSMLSVNNLTLSFGGVKALSEVSFTMQANVIHGLIGPNGAGKTSLFNVVSGIYVPTAGSIHFNGTEISLLKLHQINRLGVARTFQNIMVFPDLTLAENVMIGRQDRTHASVLASILRTPRERAERRATRERALELLSYVGLEGKADELASNLPYGEQRQLDIARALATDPKKIGRAHV